MPKTFGERLKLLISESGMSTHAFALKTGISDTALRDFVNDRKRPGIDALISISEAAGVMLDWLALGVGVKYRKDALAMDWLPWYKEKAKELENNRDQLELLLKSAALIKDDAFRRRVLAELVIKVQESGELEELRLASKKKKKG